MLARRSFFWKREPAPAVRRKGGRFELYRDKHGFVLGGLKEARYHEYGLRMSPGDKLFVYTDGVPEATAANGKMFGTDRMISALNTCADGSPEAVLSGVRAAVNAFVGDAEQVVQRRRFLYAQGLQRLLVLTAPGRYLHAHALCYPGCSHTCVTKSYYTHYLACEFCVREIVVAEVFVVCPSSL